MENLKELASKAATTVDETVGAASTVTKETIATAKASAESAYKQSQDLIAQSRGVLDEYIDVGKDWEKAAFTHLKMTRRLLYRQTIGRLQSPQDALKAVEQRVQSLHSRADDYSKEYQKLQARALAAEEEMRRGMSKLRATRSELQRLSLQVGKSEGMASAALGQLRELRSGSNLLQLRAEAASKLSAFRQQRQQVDKIIQRIVSQDL